MTKSVFSARYDRFRRMLVEARQKAGLSQYKFASLLNKPQSFVSKYERGERRLDVVEFLDIAEALRLDPTGFLRRLTDDENTLPPQEAE